MPRTGVSACPQSDDWEGAKTAAQRLGGAVLDIAAGFAHRWPERATLMLIEAGFVASQCMADVTDFLKRHAA